MTLFFLRVKPLKIGSEIDLEEEIDGYLG